MNTSAHKANIKRRDYGGRFAGEVRKQPVGLLIIRSDNEIDWNKMRMMVIRERLSNAIARVRAALMLPFILIALRIKAVLDRVGSVYRDTKIVMHNVAYLLRHPILARAKYYVID